MDTLRFAQKPALRKAKVLKVNFGASLFDIFTPFVFGA